MFNNLIVFLVVVSISALVADAASFTAKFKDGAPFSCVYNGKVKCQKPDGSWTGEKSFSGAFTKRTFDHDCQKLSVKVKCGSANKCPASSAVMQPGNKWTLSNYGCWFEMDVSDQSDNKSCLKLTDIWSESMGQYVLGIQYKGNCNQ